MADENLNESNQKTIYSSPIAQTIESVSNMINGMKDKAFFIFIIVIFVFGYALYKSAYLFSISINNLSLSIDKNTDKIDVLNNKLNDLLDEGQKENQEQINLLERILDNVKK